MDGLRNRGECGILRLMRNSALRIDIYGGSLETQTYSLPPARAHPCRVHEHAARDPGAGLPVRGIHRRHFCGAGAAHRGIPRDGGIHPRRRIHPRSGIRGIRTYHRMSPEEKAGQLVLARYPGASIAAEVLEEFHPGGFTLFAADFQDGTPEGIAAELAQLQQDSGIPLLFAVDEEGGTVVRVSKYSQYRAEKFPAQSEVLASGGTDGVYSDAAEKSALLKSLGLNMNLAPVCDLPRSAEDYIYDRAFGTDADSVSAAVASAVRSYADNGTICALKHFPGYGNNLDTHTGISIDSRPLTELESLDLLPFRAGIEAGAPVVMVSHNIVECVNAELPGSLSPEMYSLVRSLGFDGVIMTDDLSMQAVGEYCGENRAAVQAFLAGADLLCSSDYESAITALNAAVESGEITQERLDESVLRIINMKLEYGIIEE